MESHLLQMRGLKQLQVEALLKHPVSHLLQMRGLKLKKNKKKFLPGSHIFYRCVD